jgi:CheY-like chemotaxis protein
LPPEPFINDPLSHLGRRREAALYTSAAAGEASAHRNRQSPRITGSSPSVSAAQDAALGHAIVGRARTGEELITLVAREHPDLVLVDIRLAHGSDGLAAAKEAQERFDVPAIAATGNLTAADAEAAGLLGILRKPYTSHSLRAVLDGAAAWFDGGSRKPFLRR